MKIIVVDDVEYFLKNKVQALRFDWPEVEGVLAEQKMRKLDGQPLSDEDVLALVRSADVIFLDHEMPGRNGEELLAYWQGLGIDFSSKRIIGTSSGPQPYLKERLKLGSQGLAEAFKQALESSVSPRTPAASAGG